MYLFPAIILAQPSAIQEWLEKCCWGQNTFSDMNKEQQAFAAVSAE